MDETKLFLKANAGFTERVEQIKDNQWNDPTPDSEWTVRDLINHQASESLWAVELLNGKTIADVGTKFEGDLLGDAPKARWREIARVMDEAVSVPDAAVRLVHLSYGDVTGHEYIMDLFFDRLIHTWDLAKAIGADTKLDPELVETCYEDIRERAEDLQGSGLFAEPIEVPGDAPIQDKLLAVTGRDPNWQSS